MSKFMKSLCKIAIPVTLQSMLQASFSIVDQIMIGQLEQMEGLRLIKDHIATSLSILPEDLDLTPFDRKGGLLGFYDAFGDSYEEILQEMNEELVA